MSAARPGPGTELRIDCRCLIRAGFGPRRAKIDGISVACFFDRRAMNHALPGSLSYESQRFIEPDRGILRQHRGREPYRSGTTGSIDDLGHQPSSARASLKFLEDVNRE